MMELAKKTGIDVPETALISIDLVDGIPMGVRKAGELAYAIKRFDRRSDGTKVHMEDFAQIYGVYPEEKYKSASYRNIAEVIWRETGEEGIAEFMRRLVFNSLIGNGDMHLKNWSLIYPDKRKPALSPAYDFVSTISYLPGDQLALKFDNTRAFEGLTIDQFCHFAGKARLSEALVITTVTETVGCFKEAWQTIGSYNLPQSILRPIEEHLQSIPIYK